MKKTALKTSAKKKATAAPKPSANKTPTMTKRSKFPVIQTIKDVYATVFSSPRRFFKMWIVGTVLLVGATTLMYAFFSPASGKLPSPACLAGLYLLIIFGEIVIHANFARHALLKDAPAIQKDGLFLRYMLKSLFLLLVLIAACTTIGFISGGISSFAAFKLYETGLVPASAFSEVRSVLLASIALGLSLLSLLVFFRTLLFLPATYMKKSVSMHQSFSLTKGSTLRVFGFFCLVYLPIVALLLLFFKFEVMRSSIGPSFRFYFMRYSPIYAGLVTLLFSVFIPVFGAAYAAVYKHFANGAALDGQEKTYAKIPFVQTLVNAYAKPFKAPVSYAKASAVMVALIVGAFALLKTIPIFLFMLAGLFCLIGILTLFVRTAVTKKDSLFLLDKTSWTYALRHFGASLWAFLLSLSNVFTVCLILLLVLLSVAFEPVIRAFVIYSSYPQLFMQAYPNAPFFIGLFSMFILLLMSIGFVFFFIRYAASLAGRFAGQKISFADSHGSTKGNAVRLTILGVLTLLPFIAVLILGNVCLSRGLPFAGFVALRALAFVLLAPLGVLIAEVYAFVKNKTK